MKNHDVVIPFINGKSILLLCRCKDNKVDILNKVINNKKIIKLMNKYGTIMLNDIQYKCIQISRLRFYKENNIKPVIDKSFQMKSNKKNKDVYNWLEGLKGVN